MDGILGLLSLVLVLELELGYWNQGSDAGNMGNILGPVIGS